MHTHSRTHPQEGTICLSQSTFLEGGRNLKNLEETHADTGEHAQKHVLTRLRLKPGILELSGDNAIHWLLIP